jgi:hypothetical protein
MAFGDSDLGAIFDLAAFGVPVAWNGLTVTGILDMYTDVFRHGEGPGGFETTEYLLRVPQPALQGGVPAPGDQIVVPPNANLPEGFTPGIYTVKTLPQYHDPSICDLILKGPVG